LTSITIYDGSSTIGGNKIYLEDKGRGILLDFGMNFARYGTFFEEYLKPRVSCGMGAFVSRTLRFYLCSYTWRDVVDQFPLRKLKFHP